VRRRVYVYDARLAPGGRLPLPARPGFDPWLYVFSGRVALGGLELSAGWAAVPDGPAEVVARATSDLVVFRVDRAAPASRSGTLSG
jgi:redox-sensitive bicupin YhaK (pirin superfamily)